MKKSLKLNTEEQGLLESIESGEWISSKKKPNKFYIESASNSLKKDTRLNIRMSSHDILAVKAKAAQEGMPYQTLISSVIHKFASGRLVEKSI